MSSHPVREQLRQAWPVLTPNVPYVETITAPVDELTVNVPIWGTFIFDTVLREPQTMGSRPWIEEQGTATIVLMGYSGLTDNDLASTATDIVKAWTMWINSTGDLWIHSVDAPRPPDSESLGEAYRLSITLNYRYQTRGGP